MDQEELDSRIVVQSILVDIGKYNHFHDEYIDLHYMDLEHMDRLELDSRNVVLNNLVDIGKYSWNHDEYIDLHGMD